MKNEANRVAHNITVYGNSGKQIAYAKQRIDEMLSVSTTKEFSERRPPYPERNRDRG
jgi:hypothetical protein